MLEFALVVVGMIVIGPIVIRYVKESVWKSRDNDNKQHFKKAPMLTALSNNPENLEVMKCALSSGVTDQWTHISNINWEVVYGSFLAKNGDKIKFFNDNAEDSTLMASDDATTFFLVIHMVQSLYFYGLVEKGTVDVLDPDSKMEEHALKIITGCRLLNILEVDKYLIRMV